MAAEIILQIEEFFKESLYSVRNMSQLQITEFENSIWLRGIDNEDELVNRLYEVRFLNWFELKEKHLFLKNKNTPERMFFESKWTPINSYLPVKLPIAAIGGELSIPSLLFQLQKTTEKKDSIGIVVEKKTLQNYLQLAPDFRIKELTFATSNKDKVVVLGTPLLPISGKEYWKYDNILLPIGYTFATDNHFKILQQQLNVKEEDYIVITENIEIQIISKQAIEPLYRKAFFN